MSIPPLFTCPITLDLFTDPVTLCTGQTYDRPSILQWLSSGNATCPVTMLRLHDLTMVPNRTLSHLIALWRDRTAHDYDYDSLRQTLESDLTLLEKMEALERLGNLAAGDDGRIRLVRLGFFPVLIRLFFDELVLDDLDCDDYCREVELLELALSAAVKLMPESDLGCLNLLKSEVKIESLSTLLEKGTPVIKSLLCSVLEAVLASSSDEIEDLSAMIGASADIRRSVISLTPYNEEAVKVVLALMAEEGAVERLVQEGAVEGLIGRILKSDGGFTAAAAALEAAVATEGGKVAVLGVKDGVRALVKMVFRVSDHQGSESALNGLTGICGGLPAAREEAVKAGVLTQLLLVLQSQCGWQVKVKARVLLRMLGNVWPEDSKRVNIRVD